MEENILVSFGFDAKELIGGTNSEFPLLYVLKNKNRSFQDDERGGERQRRNHGPH